ncbi:MAG: NAD(+)/NADH kinase [Oscillospiraceae bacterium]|nr:NAD(+)/NADH kinase [Oscillospiraceae bacterium]
MKIYISPNLEKKTCLEYMHKACDILLSQGCQLYADESIKNELCLKSATYGDPDEMVSMCDYILVVGGDGTILRHAKRFAKHNKAILGLNSGRLGFMATLEHDEIEQLKDFCEGRFTVSKRMMLKAVAQLENGQTKEFTALNDVVFSKGTGCKIADFVVEKNESVITALRADGLIFSTPTGATAYSLSAGGPLIEPQLDCIEFTQICPHSLFARSMIFSPDSEISVCYNAATNPHVTVEVDGVAELKLTPGDKVRIMRSENEVKLIDITGSSFYDLVNMKLIKPLKD